MLASPALLMSTVNLGMYVYTIVQHSHSDNHSMPMLSSSVSSFWNLYFHLYTTLQHNPTENHSVFVLCSLTTPIPNICMILYRSLEYENAGISSFIWWTSLALCCFECLLCSSDDWNDTLIYLAYLPCVTNVGEEEQCSSVA